MNTLDNYIYIYERLYNRKGIYPYFLSPIRRVIRTLANRQIPKYFNRVPLKLSNKRSDIIVSLTSFPTRIATVHLVIQCLLRQTVLPKKILLWLSKDQFDGIKLPANLIRLENEIFNIRFIDGDIRSHKKYFYTLSEYENSMVLLIDDDLYYPTDMIEKMLIASESHPNSVICRFGSIMKYKFNKVLPYNEWWYEVAHECEDQNLFFGSGGGTLLKKEWLYKDVLNVDLARRLTPLADDIWLNAMVNLKGTNKYKVYCGLILQVNIENNKKLSTENVLEDKNTTQIEAIMNYYKTKHGLVPFYPK